MQTKCFTVHDIAIGHVVIMSRSTENIVIEPERPRANSAPSVATLSTRGHVHYPLILNNPKYLESLPGGDDNPYFLSRTLHNGNATSMSPGQGLFGRGSHMTGSTSTRHSGRGPSSRLHQRRGTLGRALSISQEQKEKIELKYEIAHLNSHTFQLISL